MTMKIKFSLSSSLTKWVSNRRVSSALCLSFFFVFLLAGTYKGYIFASPYNTYHPPQPVDPEPAYVPDSRAYEYFAAQQAKQFDQQGAWQWELKRDRKLRTLNQTQCSSAFPELYADIDRAVRQRNGERITVEELDAVKREKGYVRGMIYEQQIYVIATEGEIYSRSIAQLLAMNRAVESSPEPLPNIEFVFSVSDWMPPTAQWALARKGDDHKTWLMPEYAFWSWPEPRVGSYSGVQEKALEMEGSTSNPTGKAWSWDEKIPKIIWRGATMGMDLRNNLLSITKNKPWADVKEVKWHDKASTDANLKTMAEHCQYKFPLNTAGYGYSGRLKYIQNCESVVIMHKDDWVTHHTHLMKSHGPEQNFVEVERDFSDLESQVEALLADDTKAKTIAENSVKTFRERYLTPASEACYWRRLIRSWSAISFEPEFYMKDKDGKKVWRGLPVESFVLERRLDWDPY